MQSPNDISKTETTNCELPRLPEFHLIIGEEHTSEIAIEAVHDLLKKLVQENDLSNIVVCVESFNTDIDMEDIIEQSNSYLNFCKQINELAINNSCSVSSFDNKIKDTIEKCLVLTRSVEEEEKLRKSLMATLPFNSTHMFNSKKSYHGFYEFAKGKGIKFTGINTEVGDDKTREENISIRDKRMSTRLTDLKNQGKSTITIVGVNHLKGLCKNLDKFSEACKFILIHDSREITTSFAHLREHEVLKKHIDGFNEENMKNHISSICSFEHRGTKPIKPIEANNVNIVIDELSSIIKEISSTSEIKEKAQKNKPSFS